MGRIWRVVWMKGISLIILLLMTFWFGSCSSGSNEDVNHERRAKFALEASQRRTAEQGKIEARKYQLEKGFAVFRYDFSVFRSGYWPHYAVYRHFGIEESPPLISFGTLEFYQGWNAEMDRLLLRRYGNEYRKYRKTVLPPPHAEPDPHVARLLQPAVGDSTEIGQANTQK